MTHDRSPSIQHPQTSCRLSAGTAPPPPAACPAPLLPQPPGMSICHQRFQRVRSIGVPPAGNSKPALGCAETRPDSFVGSPPRTGTAGRLDYPDGRPRAHPFAVWTSLYRGHTQPGELVLDGRRSRGCEAASLLARQLLDHYTPSPGGCAALAAGASGGSATSARPLHPQPRHRRRAISGLGNNPRQPGASTSAGTPAAASAAKLIPESTPRLGDVELSPPQDSSRLQRVRFESEPAAATLGFSGERNRAKGGAGTCLLGSLGLQETPADGVEPESRVTVTLVAASE